MAWYSWLVFTAIACSRNFESRPWWTATSFSMCAAGGLVVGEALLGGGDLLAGRLEPRVERLLALGFVGQPALGVGAAESSFCSAIRRSRSAFMVVQTQKKPRRSRTGAGGLPPAVPLRSARWRRSLAICASGRCVGDSHRNLASERRWAHQDSNLERAGYEPAALTVELWARQSQVMAVANVDRQSIPSVRHRHCAASTTSVLRGTPAACGCATGAAACAAPWPRSGGCARG